MSWFKTIAAILSTVVLAVVLLFAYAMYDVFFVKAPFDHDHPPYNTRNR